MVYGARFWDSATNLRLDTSKRVLRIIGMVDTGAVDGSVTDPLFATGAPMAKAALWTMPAFGATAYAYPTISFSGNTMSWTYAAGTKLAATIIYGVR